MARLLLKATVQAGWLDANELVVLIGTENAASLAASNPPGGDEVKSVTVANARLSTDTQQVRIEHAYFPDDKCATLPVGLAIRRPGGTQSTVEEDLVPLRKPPLGVARPTAVATVNPNEATIAWALSADVG
jgi:hypothetical protein